MPKVTFIYDACKGCKLCAEACPKKIIELRTGKYNIKGFHPADISEENKSKCIGCAFCAAMCPETIITVEKD